MSWPPGLIGGRNWTTQPRISPASSWCWYPPDILPYRRGSLRQARSRLSRWRQQLWRESSHSQGHLGLFHIGKWKTLPLLCMHSSWNFLARQSIKPVLAYIYIEEERLILILHGPYTGWWWLLFLAACVWIIYLL